MKKSLYSADRRRMFRETFNTEQDVIRNGGSIDSVTLSQGVAEFNGTPSNIDYGNTKAILPELSFRVKCVLGSVGEYVFVVAAYNNTNAKLYIDTELVDSGTTSGTINEGDVDLEIGQYYTKMYRRVKTNIVSQRIYNRELSAEEVVRINHYLRGGLYG